LAHIAEFVVFLLVFNSISV